VQEKRFQKRVENFTCEHCGTDVVGNGYTNHCPRCLYSKHVDINPGDRAASCGGIMQPKRLEGSTGEGYVIIHRCEKCGIERRNVVSKDDNSDAVLALAGRD
jgi:rubrerythrin